MQKSKTQILSILFALIYCGDSSLVTCPGPYCPESSPDEKAVLLLNAGNFDQAIALLEDLIAQHPDQSFRYVRLAAAYAGKGDADLFEIISKQANGENFLAEDTEINNFDDFASKIGHLTHAKNLIQDLDPAERRSPENAPLDPDKFYRTSAQTQLFLYLAILSQRCQNAWDYAARDIAARQAQVSSLETCQISSMLEILQTASVEADLVPDCPNCADVAAQIGVFATSLEIITENFSPEEQNEQLLLQLCNSQKIEDPSLEC